MTIRKLYQEESGQETPATAQTADTASLLSDPMAKAPESKGQKAVPFEELEDGEEVHRGPPPSYTDAIRHSVRNQPPLLLVFPVVFVTLWMLVHLFFIHPHAPTPNQPPQIPPQTGPPQILQKETSNSIRGTFPLRELLELTTMSGSIAVTIEPQPGYGSGTVRVSSMSGSVKVNFLESANRTYHTTIRSMSGSVTADLRHVEQGSTTINTQSGSIRLHYTPSSSALTTNVPSISTQTMSGRTKVDVDDSTGCKYLKVFAGSFRSISGSINLNMPRTWEGRLHAKSEGSGSVNVHGSGLTSEWRGKREVDASRGGDGKLPVIDIVSGGSGSIDFNC